MRRPRDPQVIEWLITVRVVGPGRTISPAEAAPTVNQGWLDRGGVPGGH
jgi:hypothetical protein